MICIVTNEKESVAIGGIKQKSESAFSKEKADILEFRNSIDWELGYLFTNAKFTRRGISSKIVKLLLDNTGDINLMATTEIESNPAMVRILTKNGFQQYGKIWQSAIHQNSLGLFLKLNK